MPAGAVKQPVESQTLVLSRHSPDCGSPRSVSPQQQPSSSLFGLPQYGSASQNPTPSTPSSLEFTGVLSELEIEGSEAAERYFALAAAAAAAAAAAGRAGGSRRSSDDGSDSNSRGSTPFLVASTRGPQTAEQQQQQRQHSEQVQIDVHEEDAADSDSASSQQEPEQLTAWREVIAFALPMLATLAADPLASLVDTAFVGHLGAAQLAGVGMAINIFSSITRLFNAPLLAVTTSTVAAAAAESEREAKRAAAAAAADSTTESAEGTSESSGRPSRATSSTSMDALVVVEHSQSDSELNSHQQGLSAKQSVKAVLGGGATVAAAAAEEDGSAAVDDELKEPLLESSGSNSSSGSKNTRLSAAVSAAVVLALSFSMVEVFVLAGNCSTLVSIWGAPAGSPLNTPTRQFLLLRGLAAPVTVLLLVMQGVFRGLQDARTPFYATLACNALNIALEPPFIFKPLHLGVQGSALATALAQTLPLAALLIVLQRRYKLRFRGLDMQQVGAMFAPTGFLLLRTVSISAVFAAATALVARAGPLAAAAHQVAFQIWMATSLLADSLAVASQTILARSTAAGHLKYARRVVSAAILMAVGLGFMLSITLGSTMHLLPGLFTQDKAVLSLAKKLMPIVAVTQPLNALAFVLDGVLYGAGGFKYASAVMLVCAAPSLGLMFMGQVIDGHQQRQRSGPNQLPFTPVASARRQLVFSSSLEPYQGFADHSHWAGFYRLYSPTSLVQPTAVLGNEHNANLNITVSGFGVLPFVGEISVAQILQGFVAQPSSQGYTPISQPAWLAAAAPMNSSSSATAQLLHRTPGPAAAAAGGRSAFNGGDGGNGTALPSEMEMPIAVYWVWAGMVMLMFMRAATIILPLACRFYPFQCLYTDLREKRRRQREQQQQGDDSPGDRGNSVLSLRSLSSLLAPQRMWAWLGRGSFFAGPAAALAAAGRSRSVIPGNSRPYGRGNTATGPEHGSSARQLLIGAKHGADGSDVNDVSFGGAAAAGDQTGLAELECGSYTDCAGGYKLAAVADEEALLAAKHASVQIPGGKPVGSMAVVQSVDSVPDDFFVVLCGQESSSTLASSNGSSSSEILSSTADD